MPIDAVVRRAYTWEFCPPDEAERLLGAPADLLSPAEAAVLGAFPVQKRRRDWLAGRLAAKRALSAVLGVPAGGIEILNEPSGAPRARIPNRTAPAFSISHCARGGLCAVLSGPGLIGADFEPIASHGPAVLDLFVHRAELAPLDEEAALWQTRLWTAKEAVLKLLELGLSCDPRDVRWFSATARLELDGPALRRWRELGAPPIRVEHRRFEDCLIAVAFTEGGLNHG